MSGFPEVSVITANYNSRPYLEAAIKSLQNQTLQSWELVLVDDASSDDSAALAEAISRNDPRIRVIRLNVNRGPAAARNCAIEAACGHWLAVFDSDDIMLPNRLKTLLARANADRALVVADNQLLFFDDMGSVKPLLSRGRSNAPRSISLAEFIDSNRLYSRTPDLGYLKALIHTPTLRRLGILYDERLRIGEDYEFMARLLAKGLTIRLEPQPLYLYRKHATSVSHRIRGQDVVALIDAEERLAREIGSPTVEEALALRKRRRSLKSMLLYDEVVTSIKAARLGRAAVLGIGAPRIWPLLTRPVAARLGRLRRALTGSRRSRFDFISMQAGVGPSPSTLRPE